MPYFKLVLPLALVLAIIWWFWPNPDLHMDCVDKINSLRQGEALQFLQRNQAQEACADGSASYDFSNGWHADFNRNRNNNYCGGVNAQNECKYSGAADDVIKTCMQMFAGEKRNYVNNLNNPKLCYGTGNPSTECGHYVNMFDKFGPHTKVACGLYQWSGYWFVTVNFYP